MHSFQEKKPSSEHTSSPRLEPFGYVCHRCSCCCRDKDVQVNPYEIARLARKLGQTTTAFQDAWTRDSAGTMLKQTSTGACVFLGEYGCTVHSDRPLVCRLYPLGRHVGVTGVEWFSHIEPHPQSKGQITTEGTISHYLDRQGAEPFIVAADSYFFWLCAASKYLCAEAIEAPSTRSADDEAVATALLDMDLSIARHCKSIGIGEPNEIDDRMQLHIQILYQYINEHERSVAS
jgi:Fe-S-cluster containining protein